VGNRHGCPYDYPGFGYTILEELWKSHWCRCSRLSNHPLVPERIHGGGKEVPDQSPSSAILPTLGRACPLLFHHTSRSYTAGPRGALLFVTIPPTVQHATRVVVDKCSILRDYSLHIVDSGAAGDVCSWGTACCGTLVDWVACRGLRLSSHGHFTDTAHPFE
jgi:hypothetical protein